MHTDQPLIAGCGRGRLIPSSQSDNLISSLFLSFRETLLTSQQLWEKERKDKRRRERRGYYDDDDDDDYRDRHEPRERR